jgi:DNA-binding winged helix-turn-helix (wHTH) protein
LVSERVHFGGFVLDLRTRLLTQGPDRVALSPKAYQLLETLVVTRPTALSKADLQNRLWPDTFVVEKNLANLVSEIRDALGDTASAPRFIRTVPRFGYAFLEQADEAVADPESCAGGLPRYLVSWSGGRVPLCDGDHVVGRDPDLTLFIDSPTVSRRHAVLRTAASGVTIQDLDSKNGTFINERRCSASTPVGDTDVIRVGSVAIRLRAIRAFGSTVTG